MRWFLERIVRRIDQQNYLSECVSTYTSEGCPYNIIHQSLPIDIHRRVVYIISIVGVCPIDKHRRVVHKIDYRSLSTIYIRRLSTVKNKDLCLEMVFIHGRMHV